MIYKLALQGKESRNFLLSLVYGALAEKGLSYPIDLNHFCTIYKKTLPDTVTVVCSFLNSELLVDRAIPFLLLVDWYIYALPDRGTPSVEVEVSMTIESDQEIMTIRSRQKKAAKPLNIDDDYRLIGELIKEHGGRVVQMAAGIDILFYHSDIPVIRTSDKDPVYSILIVEDQLVIARYLEKILESDGYHIAGTVTKGEAVATAVEKYKPDLIIMDIFLSGKMTGIDACKEIQKTSTVPVIYATANIERDVMEEAMKTGPAGYIKKPINRTELLYMVRAVLTSSND
jgi:two-component system, response regulator PdtaR